MNLINYKCSFHADSRAFDDEIDRLFQALQIVDNNNPENIGGGGKPRQQLAPANGS